MVTRPFSWMRPTPLLCCSVLLSSTLWAQKLPAPPPSPAPVVSFGYDAKGRQVRSVVAAGTPGFGPGLVTSTVHDQLDRPRELIDARMGRTGLDHDGVDRLTGVTDPRGLLTRYTRTGLGDVTQLDSPDTGTASQTFDAAGNLKTRLDSRGVLASYAYDPLNRPTSVVYSHSGKPSLTYGWRHDETTGSASGPSYGIGRLTSSTFPGGNSRWYYDAQGHLTGFEQTVDTVTLKVLYGHDGAGRLSSITYPSGRVLRLTYSDGLSRALALEQDGVAQPLIGEIRHLPWGAVESWQWFMTRGLQPHERVFDTSGRLVRYPLGAALRDLRYDAANRIVGYTHLDAASGAATPAAQALDQQFGYDELGRLTTVTTATASWRIAYDANGNRTGVMLNGVNSAYATAPTSNRLTAVSNPARNFGHDTAGNTVSDSAGYTASYGLDNRMATLTKGGVTASYAYDTAGLRVRKRLGSGATTYFVYDPQGHLLGEYDTAGRPIQEYVWLHDIPVAVLGPQGSTGTPVYFVHADHLDTPRLVLDRDGRRRWRWLSEPFGTTAPETNPDGLGAFTLNLRFPGQYFDQESGLHYNWHRDYDASVGRYVQSDPIGLVGGINTYAYAETNPLHYTDRWGLDTYICRRPLGGKPGSYAPPLINHTYICVGSGANMTCGSTTASTNGVFNNIFPGSPGTPTTPDKDYFNPEACERRQNEDSCIEACIYNELNKPRRPKYGIGPAGTDCQEYTDDVVTSCETRCVRR